MKIEVWQIYEVITDRFTTSGESEWRKTILEKWEKIEIRYPYEWHFRTYDNQYFHCTPKMIEENCILFWEIWENVRFWNQCKLKDILDLWLYERDGWHIKYMHEKEDT